MQTVHVTRTSRCKPEHVFKGLKVGYHALRQTQVDLLRASGKPASARSVSRIAGSVSVELQRPESQPVPSSTAASSYTEQLDARRLQCMYGRDMACLWCCMLLFGVCDPCLLMCAGTTCKAFSLWFEPTLASGCRCFACRIEHKRTLRLESEPRIMHHPGRSATPCL